MSKIREYIRKYPNLEEIIQLLSSKDPSGHNKYLGWVLKWSVSKKDTNYEISTRTALWLMDRVTLFHNSIDYIPPNDRDIYKLHPGTLERVAKEAHFKKSLKLEGDKIVRLYEDENLSVVIPLSHAASCKYGSSTKWCTTSKDYPDHFKHYTSVGMLFYVIFKKRFYWYDKTNNNRFDKLAVLCDYPYTYTDKKSFDKKCRYAFFDTVDCEDNLTEVLVDLTRDSEGYRKIVLSYGKKLSFNWAIRNSEKQYKMLMKSFKLAMKHIKNFPKYDEHYKRQIKISELTPNKEAQYTYVEEHFYTEFLEGLRKTWGNLKSNLKVGYDYVIDNVGSL